MSTPSAPRRPTVALAASLTAVQCVAALGWVLYAAFLPALLASSGIAASRRPLVLLADQAVATGARIALGAAGVSGVATLASASCVAWGVAAAMLATVRRQ